MASGIKVSDNCKTIFEQMKVHKTDEDATKRLRLVTFTIQDDKIEVDKTFCESDLTSDCDAFEKFSEMLKDEDCFYVLYDCHFQNKEGINKEELVFGSWIPDTCKIKSKMKYASSRQNLRNAMKGLKHDLQMNDKADCKYRDCFAKLLDKDPVMTIEGKTCSGGQKQADHKHGDRGHGGRKHDDDDDHGCH